MGGRAHARGAKQTRIQPFSSLENPREEAVQTCILLQPPGQATGFRRDANQQCDARDETVCNTLRTGQCVDLHCLFGPPLSDLIQARDHPLCYWSTVPSFFFLRGPRTRASQHAIAARTTRLEKKDVHRCHGLLGHKIRAFFFYYQSGSRKLNFSIFSSGKVSTPEPDPPQVRARPHAAACCSYRACYEHHVIDALSEDHRCSSLQSGTVRHSQATTQALAMELRIFWERGFRHVPRTQSSMLSTAGHRRQQ
jgi:hypothetical protein